MAKESTRAAVPITPGRDGETPPRISPPAVVIHAQTQSLLAKPGLRLPPDAETMVRVIYEESQKLQSKVKEYSGQLWNADDESGDFFKQAAGNEPRH